MGTKYKIKPEWSSSHRQRPASDWNKQNHWPNWPQSPLMVLINRSNLALGNQRRVLLGPGAQVSLPLQPHARAAQLEQMVIWACQNQEGTTNAHKAADALRNSRKNPSHTEKSVAGTFQRRNQVTRPCNRYARQAVSRGASLPPKLMNNGKQAPAQRPERLPSSIGKIAVIQPWKTFNIPVDLTSCVTNNGIRRPSISDPTRLVTREVFQQSAANVALRSPHRSPIT